MTKKKKLPEDILSYRRARREAMQGANLATKVIKDKTKYDRKQKHKKPLEDSSNVL